MAVQSSVITRDIEKIASQTGNIYESVVVISKRARQIAVNIKEELNNKLAEFHYCRQSVLGGVWTREQIEYQSFTSGCRSDDDCDGRIHEEKLKCALWDGSPKQRFKAEPNAKGKRSFSYLWRHAPINGYAPVSGEGRAEVR